MRNSGLRPLPAYLPQSQHKLQNSELGEELNLRGIFSLSNSTKVLFSEIFEIKVDELPVWKPKVVIDIYRLEDE